MRIEALAPLRSVALTAAVAAAGCACGPRARIGGEATTSTGAASTGGASSITASSSTTAPPPDVPDDCHPERYGECDPFCQDCPDGEKCMPYVGDDGTAWDATRCSPVAPDPKAPGEPCTAPEGPGAGVDDCEKGAMCWEVDVDTNEGTCIALCFGSLDDAQCHGFVEVCEVYNDGVLPLCVPWCDPLNPQPCAFSSDLCLMATGSADPITVPMDPTGVSFHCVLRPETEPQGFPCFFASSCDPGLACVDATLVAGCDPNAGPGCCTAWCSLAAPECPDGTVCTKVLAPHPELPAEFADLGLCISP